MDYPWSLGEEAPNTCGPLPLGTNTKPKQNSNGGFKMKISKELSVNNTYVHSFDCQTAVDAVAV